MVLVGGEANANAEAAAVGLDVGLNWAVSFGPGSLLAGAPILLGGALVVGLTTRTFGFFGLNENLLLAACIVPKRKRLIPFL